MQPLLSLLVGLSFAASAGPVPVADLGASTSSAQAQAAPKRRPDAKPLSAEALKKLDGLKTRLGTLTEGSLDSRAGKLDTLYQGGKSGLEAQTLPSSAQTFPSSARVMMDDGLPAGTKREVERPVGLPGELEGDLLRGLDKYRETRGMSRFIKDSHIRLDMLHTPGAAAVYDDEINSIILSEDFRKGGLDSALPTFYHEAGHAQWHAMGLNGNVIENEFRSWTIANRLSYEMYKDPGFQKDFKVALSAFDTPLKAAEARRGRVDAAYEAAKAAKGMAVATLWPAAVMTQMKEWWEGGEAEQMRDQMRSNPDLLAGYVANASSYKDFCKGQKEFLGGVKKSYDKYVGWQKTIPDRRKALVAELELSRQHREREAYKLKGKGRYVLVGHTGMIQRFNLKTGDFVTVNVEDNGKVAHASFDRQELFLEFYGTAERREKGLKYRNEIGFNGGGLYDFEKSEDRLFDTAGLWDASDIVFLDESFRVTTNVYARIPPDEHKARPEGAVKEEMALLDKTDTYWRQWLAEDTRWRKEHPDYCTNPDVKSVLDWIERFEKVVH